MIYKWVFILISCGVAVLSNAADITVSAGKLQEALSGVSRAETHLTLAGSMDVRDFHTLVREYPGLTSLDLSAVSVTAYESAEPVSYGPMRHKADELPAGALLGMSVSELTLPSGLTTIGEGALAGLRFVNIDIPSGVTVIADNALYGCDKLTSITLPPGVKRLGAYSFAGCTSLVEAALAATELQELDKRTFAGNTSLRTVRLPDTLTAIGEGCFAGDISLSGISLPQALTDIGKNAFYNTGLESVVIPSSVARAGDFAFAACPHLVSAVLENPAAKLGRGLFFADPEFVVFKAPGLTIFPDYLFAGAGKFDASPLTPGLTETGAYSLKDTGARSMAFGSSLVYLGDGAMENMTSLIEVDATALGGMVPSLGEDVFSGINQSKTELLIADNTADAWLSAPQWREFKVITETQKGELSVSQPRDAEVSCKFEDTTLLADSPVEISLIEIYDPSGAKVKAAAPHSEHVSIETGHLSESIYIVRVHLSNGDTAIFKLMR